MVINVDISTGLMYASGPLLTVATEYLRAKGNISVLETPVPDPKIRDLSRFLNTVRIITTHNDGTNPKYPRAIKRIIRENAHQCTFRLSDGTKQTVRQYYEKTYGKRLQYPNVVCVEVREVPHLQREAMMHSIV